MSVLIYFGMTAVLVLFGFGILAVTFRHWYLEHKQKKQEQK